MNTERANFQWEQSSYEQEVQNEAARLVRDGFAAPWEAITRAHAIVQDRRREAARQRGGSSR